MCIIIEDIHQIIGHCLIPLDPKILKDITIDLFRIRESLLERFTDDFVSGQCSASVYQVNWYFKLLKLPIEVIKNHR